jgi:hypothetical protein
MSRRWGWAQNAAKANKTSALVAQASCKNSCAACATQYAEHRPTMKLSQNPWMRAPRALRCLATAENQGTSATHASPGTSQGGHAAAISTPLNEVSKKARIGLAR